MGRELKRVPLDFDWPLNKVWDGYLRGHRCGEAESSRLDYEQVFGPPAGSGYQLWETTTEGSPVSPVFETLDGLCGWCETNATTFGRSKATKEEWARMLQDGLVYHREGGAVFI